MKIGLSLVAILVVSVSLAAQGKITKENVPGITNLARLETTVACSGAIKPESVPEIKKMGFASIINLRLANEQGANVEAEEAAAKAAGINYVHVPFNGAMPEASSVDRFLQAVKDGKNNPAFIHCAAGNRAAAMWFIKRTVVDKWDNDRAMEEATQLGYNQLPALKTFVQDYVQSHKK